MASTSSSFPLLSFLFLLLFAHWLPLFCRGDAAATFGLDFHHRFSDRVRRWAESAFWDVGHWPEKGTLEYYTTLVAHDRELLRGRGLLGESDLSFAGGNMTVRLNSLGFLHYAEVALGTPNVTFLVALDTGSNLFWVPCDCKSCAPAFNQDLNYTFNIFSSSSSSTSKRIPCNSSLCDFHSTCSKASDACPYKVRYASANTSTSGFLLEDILHLIVDDTRQEAVQARVPFGCGQIQTGSFLQSAAPNGLFGLGPGSISVPGTLAAAGLTSNSFSMCFGRGGIGRIRFGDKGGSDQDTTPFDFNKSRPIYNINATDILVGNISIGANFSAIFDSGTSFTLLADPMYTVFTERFNSFITDERVSIGQSEFPFSYCYSIGPNQTSIVLPVVRLIMSGGKEYPVLRPIIIILLERTSIYCLAITKSLNMNIIGQNFMTGLKIVFDREKLVLGWKEFNCSVVEGSNPLPVRPPTSGALPPSIAVGPSSFSPRVVPSIPNIDPPLSVSPLSQPLHLNYMLCNILLILFLFL